MATADTAQTHCFEYRILGSLDGVTEAPEIPTPQSGSDAEQIFVENVPGNAGIFSPRFGGEGLAPYSSRYLAWLYIDATASGPLLVEVVDRESGAVLKTVAAETTAKFYSEVPFLVPQGAVIRMSGLSDVKVRFQWTHINTVHDLIEAQSTILANQTNPTAPNCVEVYSLDDFPPPVGGEINLEPSTVYLVCGGVIDLQGNTIVMGDGTALRGQSSMVDGLSTTAPVLIRAQNLATRGCVVANLTLIAAQATQVFDVQNIVGLIFSVQNCSLVGSGAGSSIGTIQNTTLCTMESFAATGFGTGLSFDGNIDFFLVSKCLLNGNTENGFVGFDFPSTVTVGVGEISNSVFNMEPNTLALQFDPLATLGKGTFFGCNFVGSGPFTSPAPLLLKGDPRVRFLNNLGIPDSQTIGGAGYAVVIGASVPITNPGVGQFADVPGPYVADPTNERFTMSAPGVLQYTGLEGDVTVEITASVSLGTVGGSFLEGRIRLAVNGVAVPNTEMSARVHDFLPANITTFATVIMQPGDTITVQAANMVNTTNLDVASVRIGATIA